MKLLPKLGIVLALSVGCSVPDDRALPSWANGGSGPAQETCTDGDTRACSVLLGEANGAANCYYGEQVCRAGVWGACTNGTVSRKLLPVAGESWSLVPHAGLLSLSTPVACSGSPCDPSCQVFKEVPPTPLTAQGTPAGAGWQVGSQTDLDNTAIPQSYITNGTSPDCKTGSDCQFDQYCALSGSTNGCAHSKCTTGGALTAGCGTCSGKDCDPCVRKICNADPTCCSADTCVHPKCSTGDLLTPGCDTSGCVAQICTSHPECCVRTALVAGGYHDVCTTDANAAKLPTGVDSCVTSVCSSTGNPSCCTNTCAHDPCVVDATKTLASNCHGTYVSGVCTSHPECCDSQCTTDPCSTRSGKFPATGSGCNASWAAQATAACARNPSCCNQVTCTDFDPCTTSTARRVQVPSINCSGSLASAVTQTCKDNPTCCTVNCSHSPWDTGANLASGCDSAGPNAVAAVCTATPSCCSNGSSNWTQACVLAYAAQAFKFNCTHSPLAAGAGLVKGCDKASGPDGVTTVCNATASCCTAGGSNWTASCVAAYEQAVFGPASSTCPHSPWVTGTRFSNSYRSCDSAGPNLVNTMYNDSNYSSCFSSSGSWSATCVSRYLQLAVEQGWSQTCVNTYMKDLAAAAGVSSIPSCETSYSQACVDNFTNGTGYCDGWSSTCQSAYTTAVGGYCETSWGDTGANAKTCMNLVKSKCSIDCSQRSWTSTCAAAVSSTSGCHETCTNWTSSCKNKVASECSAFCPTNGQCEHDMCLTGSKLADGCDNTDLAQSCVHKICALNPSCCSTEWNTYCVIQVGSVCGKNCAQEIPITGSCVPWLPNQRNTTCSGVDLTAGVPCGDVVPVCNRGTADVQPADATHPAVTVAAYPGGATPIENACSPTAVNGSSTCTHTAGIPAGKCVDVKCPGVFDTNPREILVNPTPTTLTECNCDNNWSAYEKPSASQGLTCAQPDCATATSQASVVKVNMLFMYDVSWSMCYCAAGTSCLTCTGTNGAKSRWKVTSNALQDFLKSSDSAGLNVGLRFFPGTVGTDDCGQADCNTYAHCATLPFALGRLQTATASSYTNCASGNTDTQECLMVKAITDQTNGADTSFSTHTETPLRVALGGGLEAMRTYALNNPFDRSVVVFVTDADSTGLTCTPDTTQLKTLADSYYKQYGIQTYTIGIDNGANAAAKQLLQDIADGGRGKAYFVSAQGSTTSQFGAYLNEIRNASASCELVVDQSNPIDPTNIRLNYTQGGTTTVQQLTQLTGASACGAGFYLDNPDTPTKVTLCPTTCAQVRGDSGAKLTLSLGCPMQYTPQTTIQTYTAQCGPSQLPQWGYLTYNTSTPKASTITFDVTTADTNSFTEPPSTPVFTAAVAHGPVGNYTTDTQVCPMGGPNPPCPISLYSVLGSVNAMKPYLQLRLTLLPAAGAAPKLTDWTVTYSCLDSY
jgi:hypothetical protein